MGASEDTSARAPQGRGIEAKALTWSAVERLRPGVALAAAIWSLVYGALGVYWSAGGQGFPFGAGSDPVASASIPGRATAASAAPFIAMTGFFGAIVAVAVTFVPLEGTVRAPRSAFPTLPVSSDP